MTIDPLLELCRDRPLLTPEFHAPNDFYGHAHNLKQCAGLPLARPLKVVVEHGVNLRDQVWDVDVASEMDLYLCAGETHAREYERRSGGRKRAIAIGPMFRYAATDAAPSAPPVGGRSLLVFPVHSTHRVRARFDARAFADEAERIARDFDRVVVCLYWKDVLFGLREPFQARGFQCVSAGHMFDFGFLPRLRRIVEEASMVLTNEIGTQILIATLMGKPVMLRRSEVALDGPEADAPAYLGYPRVQQILRLFQEPRSEPSAAQRSLVEEITGAAHTRTPSQLRQILEEAEQDYGRRLTAVRRVHDVVRRGAYFGRRARAALSQALPFAGRGGRH